MTKIVHNSFYPVYRYLIDKVKNNRKVEKVTEDQKTNNESKQEWYLYREV